MNDLVFSKYAANRTEPYPEYWGTQWGEQSYRTIHHHDRAEITYSPYFRRMAFRGYHFTKSGTADARTRLLHSIEVATIASGMCRRLGLNADLAEAIAMGHDVAQPPCGYPADRELDAYLADQGGFDHGALGRQLLTFGSLKKKSDNETRFDLLAKMACYEVIKLGDTEYVTTISKEVLDGIAYHTPPRDGEAYDLWEDLPHTLEGQIVRVADNLSYISQELDEAIRLEGEWVRDKLDKYASRHTPLRNRRTDEERIADKLEKGDPDFVGPDSFLLRNVFGPKLGPRLMTFVKRFEQYNTAMFKGDKLDTLPSKNLVNGTALVKLRFDPDTQFLLDFIWDDIIADVNKIKRIQKNVEKNRQKITSAIQYLTSYPPNDEMFKERQREVTHFYPALIGTDGLAKRAVVHHIAVLTDREVEKLGKGRGGA